MKKHFILGVVAGGLFFGTVGAFAGQYVATENPFLVYFNNEQVAIEGYNIEGSTYFKLRDIGEIAGFKTEFWDFNQTIRMFTNDNSKNTNDTQVNIKTQSPTINYPTSAELGKVNITNFTIDKIEYDEYFERYEVTVTARGIIKSRAPKFNIDFLDKNGYTIGSYYFVVQGDVGDEFKLTKTFSIEDGTAEFKFSK